MRRWIWNRKSKPKKKNRLQSRTRREYNKDNGDEVRDFESLDIDDPNVREELYREFASDDAEYDDYDEYEEDEQVLETPLNEENINPQDPEQIREALDNAMRDEFEDEYLEVETFD